MNHIPRIVKVAKLLCAEKDVAVPKYVFNDILSSITSKEGINLVSKRPYRGCFEVNGLMKDIRRSVKSLSRKYKDKYAINLDNKSAREKKRCLISIRPILPNIPEKAKAQYSKGVARFIDGPFKGEEVIWSSRASSDNVPDENELRDDIFIVEPDRYRATFYGWKKKY